ncbi:MAG: rhodanese-related sulfurtransferase [Leptospira sp.]|nr:rhodanese-related sulfurtransferase [Leptospira sp.]
MSRRTNIYDEITLRNQLEAEAFERTNLSFYRYVIIENTQETRDRLFTQLNRIGVLGRIYIAREGINAQISVPDHNLTEFIQILDSFPEFREMYLNFAIENKKDAFLKLIIKIRKKIVADGLKDDEFDVTNVGTHLTAEDFNRLLEDENSICIDMRNSYESEVGHFEGAILPEAETFRDELPEVLDILEEHKDKKILLYCTGGIRCEKASAFIKHHGYKDVYQLRGGIISYAQEIKEKDLPSKFLGKNFVFDERLGERITDDILAECHICGTKCDTHTNCKNPGCHVLMIQCPVCSEKLNGCCSDECKTILLLPESTQMEIRRTAKKQKSLIPFSKSRKHKSLYLPSQDNQINQ